jgi:hypothetical protein
MSFHELNEIDSRIDRQAGRLDSITSLLPSKEDHELSAIAYEFEQKALEACRIRYRPHPTRSKDHLYGARPILPKERIYTLSFKQLHRRYVDEHLAPIQAIPYEEFLKHVWRTTHKMDDCPPLEALSWDLADAMEDYQPSDKLYFQRQTVPKLRDHPRVRNQMTYDLITGYLLTH